MKPKSAGISFRANKLPGTQFAPYKLGRHMSNIKDICCIQVSNCQYKPRTSTLSAPTTHCPSTVRSASTYRLLTNFCSLSGMCSSQ